MTAVIQPRLDPATMPDAFTRDDFLAIIRDAVGDVMFEAQMADPDGAGFVYEAIADVFAALSEAQVQLFSDGHILAARDGSLATGNVEIHRRNTQAGAVTLLPGTLLGTKDGRLYVMTEPAEFGQDDTGPVIVPVRSTAMVDTANLDGEYTSAGGETVPGLLVSIVLPLQDPPGADLSRLRASVQ